MSSILTNNSAMTALQNLSATQKSLATTQSQISSGLKVAQASDNVAYWSIATSMRSDTGALSAVSDALNLGSSVVSTATTALNATLTILNKIKQDVVTAQQSGTSTSQVQTDIKAQQQSLINILGSASFNGVNLLDGSTNGSASFVASFTRDSSGSTSTNTFSIDTSGAATGVQLIGSGGMLATALGGATGGTAGSGSNNANTYAADSVLSLDITQTGVNLATLQSSMDTLIKSVTSAGASLGTASTTITNQQSYVSALSDAITSGVGSLVDADMNVASTRLQALQTQQQLGIQSLSIANQNSQLILKLFGG